MNEQDQASFQTLLRGGKPSGTVVKTVNYFGIDITIPAEHNHIATNRDGFVYSYSYSPQPFIASGIWVSYIYSPSDECYVYNIGQTVEMWQHTYMLCQ